MGIESRKKSKVILWLLHLGAWLLVIGSVWGILINYLPFVYVFWKNTIAFSFIILLFYLTSDCLIPHYFEKGRYPSLVLISTLVWGGVVLSRYWLEEIWLPTYLGEEVVANLGQQVKLLQEMPWIRYAFSSLVAYVMGFFYRLLYVEVLRQNRKNELLTLQYETDLKQLLHQINPHFLFNTLNNIYTLAVVEDKRTASMLLKLSNMLRTILYQAEKEFIPLEKEIELINNVLDIYSLKHDPLPVEKIKIKGTSLVPPILFLPIIENMFKHGDGSRPELWKIEMESKGGMLYFDAQNPVARHQNPPSEGSGIGLQNVEKRLKLLFGEAQSFEVAEKEGTFLVKIKFPLR